MDFNPISIDDDRHTQRRNGGAVSNGTSGNGPNQGSSGRGSSGLLRASSSFGDALRACRSAFYYHTSWSVPYPEVPASPMLYYPDEYRCMVESTMPLGVMQSELDAMQTGLLDSIPLAYYPLEPNAVEEARQAMQRVALKKKRLAAATAAAAGGVNKNGEETNGGAADGGASLPRHALQARLAPGDAAIASILVDANEIQLRNLPSLTHIQRPLYTDMGLVSQEDRHAARVARTQPRDNKPHDAAVSTAEQLRQWRLDVQASFHEAANIDAGFARFMGDVAHAKLGLDRHNSEHLRLTRALWSRLFQDTTKRQQRKVWYALCHFSSVFSDARGSEAVVGQLHADFESLQPPHYTTGWRPLLQAYVEAVSAYVASLPGGVEQRREHLQFHDKELDQLYTGNVYTNLELEGKLVRVSGDRLKNAIYPVEVVPVYPSGYQQAATLGTEGVQRLRDSEKLDFLAERDASLHHVLLPDAVLHKSAVARPNMLVGGCNLLVAEEGDFSSVQPGSTLRYSVSEENAYQSLQKDPVNTASYLLRVEQAHPDGGSDTEAAVRALGTNHDGRYMLYDRVGHRDVYQKTNTTDSNTLSRYVVMFADAPIASAVEDRSEEDVGGQTEVEVPALAEVRVKRERSSENVTQELPKQVPRTEE